MGAKNLVFHHFGESENGVERRAQFVVHLREETRLADIGRFRTRAGFVGNRLRLFEFADQSVFFRSRHQRCNGGRIDHWQEARNSLGHDHHRSEHKAADVALKNGLSAIAAVSGSVAAKAAIGRLEASMLETAITISITKIMNVFAPGSTLIGLTRTNIHASPRHRSSRMKRKRHWRIVRS